VFLPRSVKELNVDGSEIRPVPGYEGYFINRSGVMFSIVNGASPAGMIHPRYARIVPINQGIKPRGQDRLYKTEALALAFKD
jgi:hypothetical protein